MDTASRSSRFTGRVALVTGAGAGIGAAVCHRLADEGATVVAADLSLSAAVAMAADRESIEAVGLDVTDANAATQTVADAVAAHGRLDVLVNCAGSDTRDEVEALAPRVAAQRQEAAAGRISTPLEATASLTDEQWRRVLSSHLDGTFYCTRAALGPMGRQRSGSIVNVSSMWGIAGATGQPHYSAAKGAVLAFTRSVAKEVIVQGIRVNAVAPGWVETPRLDALDDLGRRQRLAQAPIGRFAEPDEIAHAVLFLASDEASYFVGATLSANGGVVTA